MRSVTTIWDWVSFDLKSMVLCNCHTTSFNKWVDSNHRQLLTTSEGLLSFLHHHAFGLYFLSHTSVFSDKTIIKCKTSTFSLLSTYRVSCLSLFTTSHFSLSSSSLLYDVHAIVCLKIPQPFDPSSVRVHAHPGQLAPHGHFARRGQGGQSLQWLLPQLLHDFSRGQLTRLPRRK